MAGGVVFPWSHQHSVPSTAESTVFTVDLASYLMLAHLGLFLYALLLPALFASGPSLGFKICFKAFPSFKWHKVTPVTQWPLQGVRHSLCVFGVRPGNNCSTTWQLLKPDRWRQGQTALETLCCPVSARPLAFHRHWQESYLLCYFIYRNKIRLKLSEIMSICLVFSVWESCVGQHYHMHSKQTDWSHSCRSET